MKKLNCKICNNPIETKSELIAYSKSPIFLASLTSVHKKCYHKKYENTNIFLTPIQTSPLGMIILGVGSFLIFLFVAFKVTSFTKDIAIIACIPLIYAIYIWINYFLRYY